METKANYVLVGVFTVVILLLSFGFVYWSANVSDQDQQVSMIVRIEGSVTGLSVGSQVLFNGLRVGDVRNLRIDPNDPRVVIATTRIEGNTPITTSTRATIGFAGLTGQAFIELKGGDVTERNIIAYAQEQGATPVIKADPSDVTDILATAKDIAERANNILTQFEAVAKDIQPAVRTTADNITATSTNVRVFTDSLAANAGQIDEFLGSISRLAGTANTVAEALPDAIRSAQDVVEAIDPTSVRTTVDNVAAITGTLRAQSDKVASVVSSFETAASSVGAVGETIQRNTPAIDRFLTNLGPISDTATSVATRLDAALASTNEVLASVSPDQVRSTVSNISTAAEQVRNVASSIGDQSDQIRRAVAGVVEVVDNVDRITEGVATNSEAISDFLTGIGPLARNANTAVTSFNETVTSANRVIAAVNSDEVAQTVSNVSGIVAAINAKAQAIQSVIDGVDRTIRTVDTTLTGFDGTRERVDGILAGIEPEKVNRAVDNVSSATDNVAKAADSIASIANDIGARRDDINRIITNAEQTSEKVNTASTRLDTVLASLDRLLRADSTEGLAKQASETLASIRQVAANINSRVGPIADNIQSFSGNGLRELQSLVRDATRSVNRIEGAVSDFQSNPSRIIFGGEEVKQYNGRTDGKASLFGGSLRPIFVTRKDHSMYSAVFRSGLLAALAFGLASCASLGGSTPPDTYEISAPKGNVARTAGATRAQLLIPEPTAIKTLDSSQIVIKPTPYTVEYLGQSQWSDRLPRMVQLRFVQAFENSGRVAAVGVPGQGLAIDYQVVMEIRRFEIDAGDTRGAVVEIAVKALNDRTGAVRATRVFTNRAALSGTGNAAYVAALDRAFAATSAEIVAWMLKLV